MTVYDEDMSIHRTIDGPRRIAQWCEAGLDRWPLHDRTLLDSPLGPTHMTSAGNGPRTLVWLPGTNFNAAVHADLARRLVEDGRFRLRLIDLPGQPGLSSAEKPGKDRLARYGHWLPTILASIDDGAPITLVGHSLGAAVVLASEPSNRVDEAVLLSPAGLAKLRITLKLLRVTIPWMVRPTRDRAAALTHYMTHPQSPSFDEVDELLELAARHTRPDGAPPPLPPRTVEQWRGRARVITGDLDPFLPPDRLREPARKHLGVEVEVVTNAGHLLAEEQPEQLISLLASGADHR